MHSMSFSNFSLFISGKLEHSVLLKERWDTVQNGTHTLTSSLKIPRDEGYEINPIINKHWAVIEIVGNLREIWKAEFVIMRIYIRDP